MLIKQPAIQPLTKLKKGIYKHYKGGFFKVHGVAKLVDSEQEMVVYGEISRGIETGEGPWLTMPLDQFCEEVSVREKSLPRFQYVSER